MEGLNSQPSAAVSSAFLRRIDQESEKSPIDCTQNKNWIPATKKIKTTYTGSGWRGKITLDFCINYLHISDFYSYLHYRKENTEYKDQKSHQQIVSKVKLETVKQSLVEAKKNKNMSFGKYWEQRSEKSLTDCTWNKKEKKSLWLKQKNMSLSLRA